MSRLEGTLLALWITLMAPATQAALHPTSAFEDLLARSDSLRRANQLDAALSLADSGLTLVRQSSDSLLITRFLTAKGRTLVSLGRAQAAEEILWQSIEWAESLRDTSLLCEALDQQCFAVDAQGRPPRVVALFERLIDTARASGDTLYVARGQMLLGRRHMRSGEFDTARTLLQKARDGFHAIGGERNELNALNLLGVLEARLGSHSLARQHWSECLLLARRLDYTYMEANLLFNLAILDFRNGDPSRAPAKFLQAHRALESIGRMRAAILPATEAASALIALGRYDEAETILKQQLQTTREQGYSDLEARVLSLQGSLDLQRQRLHASAAAFRMALSLAQPSKLITESITAVLGLADALSRMDSAAVALTLLESRGPELRRRAEPLQQLELDGGWARVLLKQQRWAEALDRLGDFEARAESLDARGTLVRLLPLAAEAHRESGNRDEALAFLQRAAAVWESERGVPRDPEWREERGAQGARISTELARVLLDTPAPPTTNVIRKTFDTLQRFKARTLLERMADPAMSGDTLVIDTSPVTLATLQEEVLAEGELLLDAFVGPETSWLFAVTQDSCRVVQLEGVEAGLHERLEIFLSLLTFPLESTDEQQLETTCAAIRDGLFREVASEIAAAERVLFVPDGPLDQLPLDVLLWGTDRDSPETGEIVHFPSATILALLRTAPGKADEPDRGATLLAVGGNGMSETSRLAGAEYEVQELQHRYRNVDVVLGGRDTLAVPDICRYDILHLAAHTVVDDQNPWRSGIVLSGSPSATGKRDPAGVDEVANVLRAGSIASMQLKARLAVLSGCESAGGRIVSGEGILGLTAAFLSAGVPAVVATLWPVDDRVTAQLMLSLYAALETGQTLAAALRTAQNQVRADRRTSHPFYWAGFVVVGNGNVTVELSARESSRNIALRLAIGLGFLGVTWGATRTWARRRLDAASDKGHIGA